MENSIFCLHAAKLYLLWIVLKLQVFVLLLSCSGKNLSDFLEFRKTNSLYTIKYRKFKDIRIEIRK